MAAELGCTVADVDARGLAERCTGLAGSGAQGRCGWVSGKDYERQGFDWHDPARRRARA
ncbi:hypothetical protein [Roseovarius mucosus]|uniref:hypothetical protein n=1 Tax=Roseovarius mucosus TaxID=215743 RepID=UPI0012FBD472|nr:hypothetical protein [Roseovarius mucosus]